MEHARKCTNASASHRICPSAGDHHSHSSVPHSAPATPSGSTSIAHARERMAREAAGRAWQPSRDGRPPPQSMPTHGSPPPAHPLPRPHCRPGVWGLKRKCQCVVQRGRSAVDGECHAMVCALLTAHTHARTRSRFVPPAHPPHPACRCTATGLFSPTCVARAQCECVVRQCVGT